MSDSVCAHCHCHNDSRAQGQPSGAPPLPMHHHCPPPPPAIYVVVVNVPPTNSGGSCCSAGHQPADAATAPPQLHTMAFQVQIPATAAPPNQPIQFQCHQIPAVVAPQLGGIPSHLVQNQAAAVMQSLDPSVPPNGQQAPAPTMSQESSATADGQQAVAPAPAPTMSPESVLPPQDRLEHVVVQQPPEDAAETERSRQIRVWKAFKSVQITEDDRFDTVLPSNPDVKEPATKFATTSPPVKDLHVDLVSSEAGLLLQEVLPRSLSEGAKEAHNNSSFADRFRDLLILHTFQAEFPDDPCSLDSRTTVAWVRKMKITAKLICLMQPQSYEQNYKSCPDLKRLPEVAEQYIEIIRRVAYSFSILGWTDGHIVQMLAIFDTIADVLCSIQHSPSGSSSEFSCRVAEIVQNMEKAFITILNESGASKTIDEIGASKKIDEIGASKKIDEIGASKIHPSTRVLIQALEFFEHIRVVKPRDYIDVLQGFWVSKIKEAAAILVDEVDRYIFILKNTHYVQEIHSDLLLNILDKLKKDYIGLYVDKEWRPLVPEQPKRMFSGSNLKNLKKHISSNYGRQRQWRVQHQLKKELGKRITELFDRLCPDIAAPTNQSPSSSSAARISTSQGKTVEELKAKINHLFEVE